MGMYTNIGGGSKQLTSLYINKDGSSKKLSACYANIKGSSKNLLDLTYVWYKYPVNKWEDTAGTSSTFSHTDTDNRECSLCGGHHYYTSGYLYISDGDRMYSSYGFNSSTGLYYGSGSSISYSSSTIDNNSSAYNGYYYFSSSYHCLYKIGSYEDEGTNEHGWSIGSGHDISSYRFAKAISYNSSTHKVVTSNTPYLYDDGEYFNKSTNGYQHHASQSYDPNDASNNDRMEWYYEYYVVYMGRI